MLRELRAFKFERHSEDPFGADSPAHNGLKIGHVALHNSPNENAGDTLLPQAVRAIFERATGQPEWHFLHLWDRMGSRHVERHNESLSALLIGGGGFIIKDQWGSDIRRSGWSWNIGLEDLRHLKVPCILFAVGYNRFRGQPDFDPIFTEHIAETVRRSVFVGLRNSGSIRRVASYLPEELKGKLTLQFCPTLCSYQLWPESGEQADTYRSAFRSRDSPKLGFNFAGDRLESRFKDKKLGMQSCARVIARAASSGWRVVMVAHKQLDRQLEPYLDAEGVDYDVLDLTFATYREILQEYAAFDLVVGMRGHAQMIPLGLRCPILSVISHDKMAYLLEDIEHPEWGVDVNDPDWEDALVEKIQLHGLTQRDSTVAAAAAAQGHCWQHTLANMQRLAGLLDIPYRGPNP